MKNDKLSDIIKCDCNSLSDEDISLIEFNLSLTPEERLENHQRALETLNEILKARDQIYGKLEFTIKTPP